MRADITAAVAAPYLDMRSITSLRNTSSSSTGPITTTTANITRGSVFVRMVSSPEIDVCPVAAESIVFIRLPT